MKTKTYPQIRAMGAAVCAALLPMLSGCVSGSGYATTRVQADVMLEDDYVYYPEYEVYYSNRHHNYVYRDGGRWITRTAPPRVGVDVLVASPSGHVDFHDSPERHHAEVIKTYPRHWRPAGHEVEKDNRGHDRRDEDRDRKPGHRGDHDDDDRKRD